MARIVILFDEVDRSMERFHLIHALARHWADAGHRVVGYFGLGVPPLADLAILHVDLSVVPPEYLEAMRRYPVAVNEATGDIRKRSYSALVLRRGESWDGPVMVKSDLNSGGRPEAGKAMAAGAPGPTWLNHYRVFASLREVPVAIWDDPYLVVEKFLPETDGESYVVRNYYFFGDAELSLLLRSRSPEVKGENAFAWEQPPIPQEIRELRRRMGFGYGKFDYALRDGRVVLYDANRTPANYALKKFGLYEAAVPQLAAGLQSLLA